MEFPEPLAHLVGLVLLDSKEILEETVPLVHLARLEGQVHQGSLELLGGMEYQVEMEAQVQLDLLVH